jgi:hypothetical protein
LQAAINSGPLHTVADGQNGVYSTTIGAFPDQSWNSSNYFVDAVVDDQGSTPLVSTARSPAPGATGVGPFSQVRVSFSRTLEPTSVTTSSFTLTAADGSAVPASVSLDASDQVATLTPNTQLAAGTTYTARLDSSIATPDGTSLGLPYSWTFTTVACPCTLFSNLAQPANQPAGTYELGVKIRVDQPMQLSAIRFYKASGENGSHTGTVWTANGLQLAQVAFSGESASGWQQQALPNPLLLQPNTTYVLSVNANNSFAQTAGGLQAAINSGPLHTVADGQNGVYSTTIGAFPDQSWNSSNYFVDLVVTP